ncbi:unnamed protein product [Rotaria magnacalcarata]|uniref:YihY/virulence factor BrkB family protein n=1 Tax=Rotaria magnacalcarata TaxID=392030 RepID=A0A815RCW7_9BILA|nr:unnamed protein product [Rotaria magnacalcarata]CAF3825713.1 unnamed protein product [Rotaria magnacalcarata]
MLSNETKETITRIRRQLSLFGWKILYDWTFSLAALIAYYLLISLLPLAVSLFAVVSLIFNDREEFQKRMRDRLTVTFPERGFNDTIDSLFNSISKQAGVLFAVGFVISIFTGSRLFVGIDDVLTIIYRIRERTILDQNFLALKMILAFITITPFIILFSSVPAILESHQGFYQFLVIFTSCILSFIFIELIYVIVPKRQMRWKHTWCGALVAAVGLQLVLLIFPWYVHQFMNDYAGQLGFVIVILLFFYLFGLLFVIGAQINAFFFDHIQPLKAGLGTCLCESVDRELIQLTDESFQTHEFIADEINHIDQPPLP